MGIFFKAKREPGWLAVALSPESVEVAHIRHGAAQRPEVRLCDCYRKEGGDAETLKRLRKELHMNRYRCSALLNAGEYQMLQVEAPNVPQAEMKTAMRWRIKDMLDYPVDSATIDVLDIPVSESAAARGHSMFAVAAKNDLVSGRMRLFGEAEIPLAAIDIPEMAQRNIAALFEQEGRGLALLAFDARGGLLTFTCRGELYLSRHIEISAQQLLEADEAQRTQHYERIALELQRSLDHFERQYHFITIARLLLAPFAAPLELQQYLAANLYIPVETLDLGQVMDFPAAPELKQPEHQARCLQILGAALRGEEKAA